MGQKYAFFDIFCNYGKITRDAVKQTAQSEHAAHALQLSFGHDEYQKIRNERSEDPELQVELPTHQHMCLACDTNTRDRMSWAKHFDLRLSRS